MKMTIMQRRELDQLAYYLSKNFPDMELMWCNSINVFFSVN